MLFSCSLPNFVDLCCHLWHSQGLPEVCAVSNAASAQQSTIYHPDLVTFPAKNASAAVFVAKDVWKRIDNMAEWANHNEYLMHHTTATRV